MIENRSEPESYSPANAAALAIDMMRMVNPHSPYYPTFIRNVNEICYVLNSLSALAKHPYDKRVP